MPASSIRDLYADVRLGLISPPRASSLPRCGAIAAAFVIASSSVAAYSPEFRRHLLRIGIASAVALISPLVLNAAIEEVVFRGLFVPHRSRALPETIVFSRAAVGGALFVLWHPFAARFLFGFADHPFMKHAFLLIVALLGACPNNRRR
jgi:predicted Abi (CAAX) family protease